METTFLESVNTGPVKLIVESNEQDGNLLVQLPGLGKDMDLLLFGNEPASVMANGRILPRLKQPGSSAQDGSWDWNLQDHEIGIYLPASPQGTTIIIRNPA